MPHVIDCFMWGFQPHFRSTVEHTYRDAIAALGREVEPEVFLIGFRKEGASGPEVCVEPEDGPITPADFTDVPTRGDELYREDGESRIWNSDPRTHDLHQGWVRDRAWARAIGEDLEARLGLHFEVASPTAVGDFRVFTAVGVPNELLDGCPSLTTRKVADDDRITMSRSLVEAALGKLDAEASQALHEPDPGSRLGGFVSSADVARSAGETLAIEAAYRADPSRPAFGFFDAMNRLATTSYERRIGVGRLILARQGATGVASAVLLKQPVPLKETRTLRKLLEISSRGTRAVLINGREAYGLGTGEDSYETTSESVFEVVVSGPGTWDLRHAGVPLMAVTYGSPHLPEERLSRARFDDTANRIFAAAGGCDVDRLWTLAMAAADAEHGTMLVVSSEAASEASRLSSQALDVEPLDAEVDLVRQVSKIDGAMLIDQYGRLEAIGVILDGVAGDRGDRARGARFNSAVRYLDSATSPTMIVLVSEDGMLDLLPRLRPRMRRTEISELFAELRSASAIEPVHPERFFKAFRRIEAARFYLNADQCDEANKLAEDHWTRRRAAGATIWTSETPLRPHPDMSDEYLID
jgi:hypothetical protein